MKEGAGPEVLKARESRGKPRVGHVRGSGPCRGVIERPGGSRHDRGVQSCTFIYWEAEHTLAISHWLEVGEVTRVWVCVNISGECRGAPLRVRETCPEFRKGKLRRDS